MISNVSKADPCYINRMSAFAVDKQRSLAVIQRIIDERPSKLNREGTQWVFNHRLAIAYLYLNDPSIEPTFGWDADTLVVLNQIDDTTDIDDVTNLFIEESQKPPGVGYRHDTSVEISNLVINNDDKIIIDDLTFSFNEKLRSWIIVSNYYPKGINGNGCATILDFREYFD